MDRVFEEMLDSLCFCLTFCLHDQGDNVFILSDNVFSLTDEMVTTRRRLINRRLGSSISLKIWSSDS